MEEPLALFLVEHLNMSASAAAFLAAFLLWAPFAIATILIVVILYLTKSFNDHVTYTANRIVKTAGGWELHLRTFLELPLGDLLPANPAFRLKLMKAFLFTKKSDPFLCMAEADMDVLQPKLINGFSMQYPDGVAAWQSGRSVIVDTYLLAVSYEKHDGIKSRKIRVIVATEAELERILDPEVHSKLSFERAHQWNRYLTLKKMAEHWKREQDLPLDSFRIVRPVYVYREV